MDDKGGTPKPKGAPAPNFNQPPGAAGAALAELGSEIKTQLSAQGQRMEELSGNVVEFSGRITTVEGRITAAEESAAAREQDLITGEQFAEVREQLEHMDQRGARLESLIGESGVPGRNDHPGLSAWAREVAENEEMIAWQKNDRVDNDPIRIKLKSSVPYRHVPAFAASTVVIDDSSVGDGSQLTQPTGLVQLLRDEIGLIDVINTVPPVTSDQYKRLVEKEEAVKGAIAAKSTDAVAGGTTAVNFVVLDNVEGYWAGKTVYFYTAAGEQGPETIVSVDEANSKLVFGSDEIDFDIAVGDLCCSKDYLMTGESEFAPAGTAEVEEKTVDMQALANYIPVTWQRMKRTNLFALMPWLEALLRERKRWTLEEHLLYGSGVTAEKQLHGFLHASWLVNTDVWATLMAVGDNVIDLIIRSASLIPGGGQKVCVMRDEDWQAAIYAKDSAKNYVHGEGEGPRIINTPALKAAGAVRVVTSAKIALKTAQVFAPAAASDFAGGGDAELIVGHINAQLITGEAVIVSRESFGHLLTNPKQAVRKITFTTAPS